MKRFKDWSIGTKVMSISVLTIVIILAGMVLYFIPMVKGKKPLDEKKASLRNVTDVVNTLVASHEARVKAGRSNSKTPGRR